MDMMRSLKAVVAGSLFIIIASLVLQLVALFVMVGYTILAKDYPYLNEIGGVFRYLVGLPVFILVMFVGGYITAMIAHTKVLQHCLVVGVITATLIMWLALENAKLTTTGIFMIAFMILASVIGGKYWQKRNAAVEPRKLS